MQDGGGTRNNLPLPPHTEKNADKNLVTVQLEVELLYNFSFLPAQVLAVALAAFNR